MHIVRYKLISLEFPRYRDTGGYFEMDLKKSKVAKLSQS